MQTSRRHAVTPRAMLLAAAVLVLLAAAGAGCTSTSDTGTGPGSTAPGGSPVTASAPTGPSKSWSDFFGRVPGFAARENATVDALDVAAARELSGFRTDGDGRDGRIAPIVELGTKFVPSFWTDEPKTWKEVLGIFPYAAERSIEINEPGKDAIVVLEGSFDVAALTEKLKGPEALGPDATTETYGGATFLRMPGDELEVNAKARRFVEKLGRPVRVLVAPDHLIVTLTDAGMHQAIDAWSGKGAATADPQVAAAIKAVDSVHAVTIAGTTSDRVDRRTGASGGSGRSGTTTNRGSTPGTARTGTTARPSGTVATGTSSSGDPARILLVGATLRDNATGAYLVAVKAGEADARAAGAGIETLVADGSSEASRQPWKELLTLDDLRTDGPLVVATFTTKRPSILRTALERRDNLTAL